MELSFLCLMNFNSIKVRLKQKKVSVVFKHKFYFNSIKVRLKHDHREHPAEVTLFQFHKGTIKTDQTTSLCSSPPISIP